MDILAIVWKESKKYKTMIAIKIADSTEYCLRLEPRSHAKRETYHYTNGSHTGNGVE